jgi:hypothetical protein
MREEESRGRGAREREREREKVRKRGRKERQTQKDREAALSMVPILSHPSCVLQSGMYGCIANKTRVYGRNEPRSAMHSDSR